MEIKVNCGCGSNYSFTEEPVNGRVRFPVKCPNCGTDGTMAANEYIRKAMSGELTHEKEGDTTTFTKASPVRMVFGVLGACAGGAIGMMIWYYISRSTTLEVGYVAWGVGALAGLGARLAVPHGSFGLAGVASLVAASAIMGAQYMVQREFLEHKIKGTIVAAHMAMTEFAEAAQKAETDKDFVKLLDRFSFNPSDVRPGESPALCEKWHLLRVGLIFGSMMKPGSAPTIAQVVRAREDKKGPTAADLALFRTREVPQLKEFLTGKPSEAEFSAVLGNMIHSRLSTNGILMQSWSPYELLWIILGIGSAYRIAYNKSETEDI